VLKANVVDEGRESNDEGAVEHYQDSDNADGPTDDSGVDHDDDTAGKKKKIKMREKYPRYLGPSVTKADLYVGMKFRDKQPLKEAVENYRIVKGYRLKITKSDTVRFQCQCLGKGCSGVCGLQNVRISHLFNCLNMRTRILVFHLTLSKGVGTCQLVG